MTVKKQITYEELMVELERAGVEVPEGGMSTQEWAGAWGVSLKKARRLIRLALEQSKMTVHITSRPEIMRPDRNQQVYLYRHVGGKRG